MENFLTRRQKEILEFLAAFKRREGVSPTHREICDRFGFSSYGTAHKHLKLLERKGYVRRHDHQKRGLELSLRATRFLEAAEEPDLPFFGRIAAGRPIEAVAGDERVPVPRQLLGGPVDQHYVLRVAGDSMIDEGIHDGDFVVVRQRSEAAVGDMVVALVGDEATLKRYFPEGDRVRLQPSAAHVQPIWVAARDLRVQGVVVGLMRRY
ncbi:MAG: transcriptional repressor LexA [Acidobacteriota bacterium]|nr:transcriptional repressor LexA [Acidobacteriota bacterium]MDH3522692.1 transcriptional repressor LexA [Acidobacteriota bacterium]